MRLDQIIPLQVLTDVDGQWPEANNHNFGQLVGIGRLAYGTASGKSSVTVRVELPDGSVAFGQTTLALLRMALQAFEGAEQRDEDARRRPRS